MPDASIHYDHIIADTLRCIETEDTAALKGGLMLVFLDERGTQVNLRLQRTAAHRLSQLLVEAAK